MTDDQLLTLAQSNGSILITNDSDFGELIFRERRLHSGVIFLRLSDERPANKIKLIENILENYSDRLPGKFVTVTETRIRFA